MFLVGPTQRLLRLLGQLRLLADGDRAEIAAQVVAVIRPCLATEDADELRQLRRDVQDARAALIYEGARDFSDLRFAVVTLAEQWAAARLEQTSSRSVAGSVLGEQRCKMIEDFLKDNLPEEP
jgi:hypothetical protein